MRPGYQKIRQCYLCHRFLRDCNANLCRQRRNMMNCKHHALMDNSKRPKFSVPENVPYLHQPHSMQRVIPIPQQVIPQQFFFPNQQQNFHPFVPYFHQTDTKKLLLNKLNDHGELVGNIHTVEMKYCSTHGIVVDWIISTSNIDFKEKNHCTQSVIPHTNQTYFRIENIVLPWSILPNSVASLPVNIQIRTTSQYIPPGSTFKVYCESYDERSNHATFRMANRSSPVLKLPQYIQKNLTYSNTISHRATDIQNSRPRFLIVIDFEATCDFAPDPLITRETSEIIEFPWVVMDTTSLDIVYKRQIYVKPQYLDGITPYCQQLTGITKENCENGLSLAEALQEFEKYLEENIFPYGRNNFRIITDGIWDLEIQLQLEAKRKGIKLGDWFQNYFDVRQEFKQFYSWFTFPPSFPTLPSMLDAYSLRFVGRHHSGLDDCQTIAQIVKILLQLHPNTFTHPKEFNVEENPLEKAFPHSSICPPGSWLCTNEKCNVWNQPYVVQCKFCKANKC